MPLYILNIIGSRRHAQILKIMEETGTNIYLPSPWQLGIAFAESESTIHVTGNTSEEVQRATTCLEKLLPEKVN
jgi:hypothetical protein